MSNRLFDRFYTVENARKSTGLGLSISRILIEQMNGTISAQYENGKLRICIRLPEVNIIHYRLLKKLYYFIDILNDMWYYVTDFVSYISSQLGGRFYELL